MQKLGELFEATSIKPFFPYLLIMFVVLFLARLFPRALKSVSRKIRRRKYELQLKKSGIKDIDKMDGFQFETYINVLFKKLGYRPEVTKKSGDFGADVILKGKNRVVIQAKRYGYGNKVGLSAVQEVYSAKAYYHADEAWVITNSLFTKQAEILAKACNVKLLDRYSLQKFIIQINPEQSAKEISNKISSVRKEIN